MRKIVNKIILGTSLAIGAMAVIAPAAFAEVLHVENGKVVEDSVHVTVSVPSTITLEISVDDAAYDDSTEGQAGMVFRPILGSTEQADFTATVWANGPYTLSINSLDGVTDMLPEGLTSDTAGVNNKIPGDANIVAGATSWGWKLADSDEFLAIPTAAVIVRGEDDEDNTPGVDGEETKFTIGLAAGLNLATDTYTGTLVITAAIK